MRGGRGTSQPLLLPRFTPLTRRPNRVENRLPKVTQAGSQDFGSSLKDITEVGSGMIDWKRIFAHSEQAGIKHYIVEHDNPRQPLESIKTSYEYLKNLRW